MYFEYKILDRDKAFEIMRKYDPDAAIITKGNYLKEKKDWKKEYKKVAATIKSLKKSEQYFRTEAWYFRNIGNEEEVYSASRMQSLRARQSDYAYALMIYLEGLKADARMTVELLKAGAIEFVQVQQPSDV